MMGYHDGTQNFMIEKYGILAFKWCVVSIFCIPTSKVIPKKQKGHGSNDRVVNFGGVYRTYEDSSFFDNF